jgi:hypothetical protein
LVDFFEYAIFFDLFGFDFCSDLFNGFKAYAGIFVNDVVLFVVANHVDDDLFDCIGYLFHCFSSFEEVSFVYYSMIPPKELTFPKKRNPSKNQIFQRKNCFPIKKSCQPLSFQKNSEKIVYFLKTEGNPSLFSSLCRMIQQQRWFIFVYPHVWTHSEQAFYVTVNGVEHHIHTHPSQAPNFDAMESRSLHGADGSLNRQPQVPLLSEQQWGRNSNEQQWGRFQQAQQWQQWGRFFLREKLCYKPELELTKKAQMRNIPSGFFSRV